jgi:predicted transglutaminase-like cysteine proteinase
LAVPALALAFAVAPAGPSDAAKKQAVPSFFSSKEVRSSNLKPFKKWTRAIKRYSKEKARKSKKGCKSKKFNRCHFLQWKKFLKGLKKKKPLAQVKAVNRVMNKSKYITDKTNWGKKDYWASPGEFMARFGDSEDFAITKYLSLRRLGFTNKQLRVVAVKDMNLKVGHAVLVVFLDGKTYLLDNQIKQLVEAKSVKHYQPVFSINTKNWWRHRT